MPSYIELFFIICSDLSLNCTFRSAPPNLSNLGKIITKILNFAFWQTQHQNIRVNLLHQRYPRCYLLIESKKLEIVFTVF